MPYQPTVALHSYHEQRELVWLHVNARSPLCCAAVVACRAGVRASSIRHGLMGGGSVSAATGPARPAAAQSLVAPIEQRMIVTGLEWMHMHARRSWLYQIRRSQGRVSVSVSLSQAC